MTTRDATLILDIDGHQCEREVEIIYAFYPKVRGLREPFGPQLEPDSPAYVEIARVTHTYTNNKAERVVVDLTPLLTDEMRGHLEEDILVKELESIS